MPPPEEYDRQGVFYARRSPAPPANQKPSTKAPSITPEATSFSLARLLPPVDHQLLAERRPSRILKENRKYTTAIEQVFCVCPAVPIRASLHRHPKTQA
jgi:hypothetical protein